VGTSETGATLAPFIYRALKFHVIIDLKNIQNLWSLFGTLLNNSMAAGRSVYLTLGMIMTGNKSLKYVYGI
jgi:hypothetical protein